MCRISPFPAPGYSPLDQSLTSHPVPKALMNTMDKPRRCDVKNLIDNRIDSLGKSRDVGMFPRPHPWMDEVSELSNFMRESRKCLPFSTPQSVPGRKPQKLFSDANKLIQRKFQCFISLPPKGFTAVHGCSLDLLRVQKTHCL